MVVMYILAVLILFIGWGIHKKQWYFLISGYNTMSEQAKAQVDVKGLAKSIAWMCYYLAVMLVALGLLMQLELWDLLWVVIVLIVIGSIFTVFYTRKFYPNGVKSIGTASPKAKKMSGAVTVVTLVGAAVLLYFSMQPTKFIVEDESFTIKGMYGDEMPWTAIDDIQLVDELPAIAVRTNGSAVGSKLKGNFKFENGDKAKLFVDKQVKSFITFTWDGATYYLNEPTIEETKALYEKMMKTSGR